MLAEATQHHPKPLLILRCRVTAVVLSSAKTTTRTTSGLSE